MIDKWWTHRIRDPAGLIVDIGVLVFAKFESDRYLPIFADHNHARLAEVEREEFGFNHAEIGARLLEIWQLSPEICQSVSAHHDATLALEVPLARFDRAGTS